MTSTQLAELKAIADTLAIHPNDAGALHRFSIFLRSIRSAERHDLLTVLHDMITDGRQDGAR